MKRIMLTFKDPIRSTSSVKWFRDLTNGRKFIRSLCFDVPYMFTIDDSNSWYGSYCLCTDVFIERHDDNFIKIRGDLYDQDL